MKTWKMHSFSLLAIVALALVVVPGATAGAKYWYPLQVYSDGVNVYAQGNFSDTRNTPSGYSYIVCGVYYQDGGITGSCSAWDDAAKQSAGCSTTNPAAIQLIESLKGDSFVAFQYPVGTSTCAHLSAQTASYIAPKQP